MNKHTTCSARKRPVAYEKSGKFQTEKLDEQRKRQKKNASGSSSSSDSSNTSDSGEEFVRKTLKE
jgi:hypothetical protein